MAKRSGNNGNQTSKKTKVDDFNDLWGDDFDGDVIDDCFERASQICEEEENKNPDNNVTSTSYSIFKQPSKMITSTQIPQAGTSHPENLHQRLKELQEKYAEKEGEVVILRSNLQSLRTTCQTEQEKKEKEWKDKLISAQKESKAIKSELEFKNLEIANLKQQITELSKYVTTDQNITQKSKIAESSSKLCSPQKPDIEVHNFGPIIQINSKIYYPLKRFDFSHIFKPCSEEKYVVKRKHKLYKSAYLPNPSEHEQSGVLINMRKPIIINEKELDLDYVYTELAFLINLSFEELDSEVAVPALNKIICVCLQLLTDLNDYLKQIEENIELQDIQESDSKYLQENSNKKYENLETCSEGYSKEIGVKSGKLIGFLAEILPFSAYFREYLLQNKTLNLSNTVDYAKLLPCLAVKRKKELLFLSLILDIITTMGRIRKEQMCSEYLCAVVNLLTKICNCNEFKGSLKKLIHDIIKEILFLRPRVNVIYRITFLLKVASKEPNFMDCLCSNSDPNNINSNTKGILYFNKDSCRFHIFVISLENSLTKINNDKIILDISLNILSFIYNIFKSNNPWLYQLEEKQCKCLCQFYKLGIGIIYKNLNTYQECGSKKSQAYKQFFKNGVQILHLLASKSCDLIQKYVTDFAQFKEIIYTLSRLHEELGINEDDLKSLEKLSLTEDVPEIPIEKFAGIDL